MRKKVTTILDLMQDKSLAGSIFRRGLFRADTWTSWKAFLSALFALKMDAKSLEVYQRHTGRANAPANPVSEAFLICGRRSGKSLIAALIATFFAAFRDYSNVLVPGESGTVMVLASDRRQAQIIYKYIVAFFSIPVLKTMVVDIFKESIVLNNQITIEIHTSDYRSIRGFSCVAAICDEVAFWQKENTQNPDAEVLRALRPALATTGGLLLCISSPYAKRGELWKAFSEFYGKDDPNVLVWKADSRSMNPTLSEATVATAYARDPAAASCEYGAEFRADTDSFLGDVPIQAVVMKDCLELGYDPQTTYFGFVDPSGGRADSFCLGIAHAEGDIAVLDVAREIKPPFNPDYCTWEFSELLKKYHIYEVTGDAYAGEWPRAAFEKNGITYKLSDKTKSEIYLASLPAIMSKSVRLLDNPALIRQLSTLERKTTAFGKDAVDHSSNSHDDLANAALGALSLIGTKNTYGVVEAGTGMLRGLIDTFTWRKKPTNVVVMPSKPVALPKNCAKCGSGNTEPYGNGPNAKVHCLNCHAFNEVPFEPEYPCPKCKGKTNPIPGGERRCDNGHQFLPEDVKRREPYRPSRKDYDTWWNDPFRKWGF